MWRRCFSWRCRTGWAALWPLCQVRVNHNPVARQPGAQGQDGGQQRSEKSITALKALLSALRAPPCCREKAHTIQGTCVGVYTDTHHIHTPFSGRLWKPTYSFYCFSVLFGRLFFFLPYSEYYSDMIERTENTWHVALCGHAEEMCCIFTNHEAPPLTGLDEPCNFKVSESPSRRICFRCTFRNTAKCKKSEALLPNKR